MNQIIIILNIFLIIFKVNCDLELSSTKSKIWGPGLNPDKIVMPARYFFIEMEDKKEITKEEIKVVIDGMSKSKQPCRIWTEILARKDNFFIVRYKLYEVCSYLKITVHYNNEHIGESPYLINSDVLPDDCNCPKYNVDSFKTTWNCENVPNLLEKQLKEFGEVDWNKKRQEVIETFDKPLSVSICHYIIKENKIYRKCYGKYVDFKMFVDAILLSLARKVKLPDVEFFTNLGDWPLSTENLLPKKFPIFSWCGSKDSFDIIWPTYELTSSVLENMGKISVNTLSVQGNLDSLWEGRMPKLFWRGRDSNRHRLNLIKIARQNPDLFNVSLTNFFFYKEEEHIYGPKSDYVSFYSFFDYKYQLAIDGTVAPYRTPFLLAGGSLIFKPESKYFEHFYNDLKPMEHYVPVKADLSDLVEKIKWAQENDNEAKKIAQNGQNFANEQLSHEQVLCYHVHVLEEFSQLIKSPIRILDGMEEVKQEKLKECECPKEIKDEL